jgi:hypothetical protein
MLEVTAYQVQVVRQQVDLMVEDKAMHQVLANLVMVAVELLMCAT